MPLSNNQKYLLLDSCIIEYWLNEHINPVITKQLTVWKGKVFELAISDVTYAELINGAKKNKEEKITQLLEKFNSLPVSKRLFRGCGMLGSVYREHENEYGNISIGDRIIASTSIIYNLPIVTANVKDFPYPFFIPIATKNLIYKHALQDRLIAVGVLKPNNEFINYKFGKRQ